MSKATFAMVAILTLGLLSVHISAQSQCTQGSNTYWTGYRCACKVGYKNESNECVPLTLMKTKGWVVREPTILPNSTEDDDEDDVVISPPVDHNCYLPFEYYNGQGCICLDGYARINGLCQPTGNTGGNGNGTDNCPANAQRVNGVCQCNQGYTLMNGVCVMSSTGSCPANSYDNGLGFCVCNSGYYKQDGVCVQGTPCPPQSSRNAQGVCVCDAGLTKYGDYCSRCPLGASYDQQTQKCTFVCGERAEYSTAEKKCVCLQGYGIYDDVCSLCPANFFIYNNYCVTCPVNSAYSTTTKRCECKTGYLSNRNGFCVKRCANNEVYNSATDTCDCFTGLGRVNGVCQICPEGQQPNSQGNCAECGLNQMLFDGRCICATGFIPNELGICTRCALVQGAFLVNGQCAVCPGDLEYNGQRCTCPAGQTRVGTRCFETCNDDELVDANGLCYSCPIYEVISNGACVCEANYARNATNGRCELACPSNQFPYQGRCAQCPLNLEYRMEINGCSCPDGQYLNNFGVCEQVILQPISCGDGFYFNQLSGCVACPAGCRTCTSASMCTSCTQTGYTAQNGICAANCGDGLIVGAEQCDDGNRRSGEGCSSTCQVEVFYTCTGQPSVCVYNGPAICGNGRTESPETCDDGNTRSGDGCSDSCQSEGGNGGNGGNGGTNQTDAGLSLVGEVNTNINNVFVVLRTSTTFTFANENEMENFMKTNFPDSNAIPSVYCSQREAPQLDIFDCLAIYSSGIPNQAYNIEFSYERDGIEGFLSVPVNPLSSSFANRSLRSSSRRP